MRYSPETLEYALEETHRVGARVLLNFAPARPLPPENLRHVEILVVNETEASFLSGISVSSDASAASAAERLTRLGPETVIITLGSQGAWVTSVNLEKKISAFSVPVVDTTAAGDTFCGALAVAIGEGKALEKALRFASAAAAISVTRFGAHPSIPTRQEIEGFLNTTA